MTYIALLIVNGTISIITSVSLLALLWWIIKKRGKYEIQG